MGISGAAQIVPEKGELGVILPITIAMKLRGTVMEIRKVGSGVKQGQFLLQQVSPLKMKEIILATIRDPVLTTIKVLFSNSYLNLRYVYQEL